MLRRLAALALVGLVVVATFCPLSAQTTSGSPDTSGYDAKLTTVRQLIRTRNLDGATALLEVMLEQSPTDPVVINLLRNTYEESRNYAKAELFAQRLVEQNPRDFGWRMYLAEIEAKLGELGAAEKAYREVMPFVTPGDSGRLYGIVNSMMAFGVYQGALDLIDSLRAQSRNPRAFGFQRGMILQQDRRFADATTELFAVMAEDSTPAAGDAERQLLSMMEYTEAAPDVERSLSAMTGEINSARGLRLLMSHAIKVGEYERAFSFAIRQDSAAKLTGLPLVDYVRQCLDRKSYQPAVRGAEYILSHYPSGPFLPEISFRYAEALARLGRHRDALAAYENIATRFPTVIDRGDALFAVGDIYMNDLNDPARAIAYFDTVVQKYPRGISYLKSIRQTPLCYMILGDTASASAKLNDILSRQFTEDIMEEAAYRRALLLLISGQFDSTKAALRKLMVDYPRGMYVNDAMQVVLDLDQVLPDTKLLVPYSVAVRYQIRRLPDSARASLAQIADAALYRMADMDIQRSDTASALADLDRLTGNFAQSFYRPYGLKMTADILSTRPDQIDRARDIYKELLEKYPDCPFVSDARKRLRRLDEAGKIG
ncbi:MAG: tetratricopeptide repeat protein [candidate division Zixibacteria bacterium]|nr:tetratricopeptide repeat protein [candidate division Zixibacteria bacterium]